MKSLATWCVRHRVVVLLLWLAALVGMTVISQSVGTAYSNSFSLPNTESTQALDAAAGRRAAASPATASRSSSTPPAAPRSPTRRSRPRSTPCWPRWQQVPHVTSIASPYGPARRRPDQQGRDDRVRHGHLRPPGPEHLDARWPSSSCPPRRRAAGPEPAGGGVRPGGRGGRQAVVRRHRARACSWPASCCCSCSARSSPWPCRCCRPWPRWARPSA